MHDASSSSSSIQPTNLGRLATITVGKRRGGLRHQWHAASQQVKR